MRTAVFVLAILGEVAGVIAVFGAFALGAVQQVNPLAGGGEAVILRAGLALVALVAVIVALVFLGQGRDARLPAGMLIGSAVLGAVGTLGFLLASGLIALAGVLALFTPRGPTIQATPMPMAETPPAATAPARTGRSYRRPLLATGGVVAVIIVGLVVAGTLGQASEQRAVRALFDKVASYDNAGLTELLPPDARSGDPNADAERALSSALARSELAFLAGDWTRRFGPASGTQIAFNDLQLSTLEKTDDAATVQASGTFAPSNQNPIANALVQVLKTRFTARVALRRVHGNWYVAAAPVAASNPSRASPAQRSASAAPAATATPTTAPAPSRSPSPTSRPLSSTPPSTPAATPVPTAAPFNATWTANFNDPVGSGLPDKSTASELRYQGGHALITGCDYRVGIFGTPYLCTWGINRDASGFSAVTVTAQATNPECPETWGLVFRAGPAEWSSKLTAGRESSSDSYALQTATVLLVDTCSQTWGLRTVTNGKWGRLRDGNPATLTRNEAHTLELGIDGAQIYGRIDGVEVVRLPDSQARPGLGFGIYGYPNLQSIDITRFAGR